MSGKPKQGIDYAGWNTHIFEDEPKIDKLLDAQGWVGFGVYYYLCQRAYANGYFYPWRFADSATTARKMAGGMKSETVKAAVGACARVGLFDKRLLETEGILTSKGIQRGLIRGIEKRSYRSVDHRYWLLDEAETKAARITFLKSEIPTVSDSIPIKDHVLPGNADVLPENDPNIILYNTMVNSCCNNTRTREETELGRVMSFYLDRINPTPSEIARTQLADHTKKLGADIVLRALDIALDERKTNWSYINAILNNWTRDGVKTLADVERMQRERSKNRGEIRKPVNQTAAGNSGTNSKYNFTGRKLD